jgi:hypothetical protein
MEPNELRQLHPGDRVVVAPRSEEKKAVVVRVPPFTENVCGTEYERTESVMVEYPNTSFDGGDLFGNMRERIEARDVVRRA